MKKKKNGFSLFAMLVTFSLIPLVLSIAVISFVSLYITRNNLEQGAEDSLYLVANNLANHCKENEITAMNAGDYYDYLDSLKEQNIEMAIISDGMPCATSIKNENDFRIREIEFDSNILQENAGLDDGYYNRNVVIDGNTYYAYYMPIRINNEITGVAFAGELQNNVTGAIQTIVITFSVLAVVLIVLFMIVILLFSRNLSKAFTTTGSNINALSKGNLKKQKLHNSFVKEMNGLLVSTGLMQENLSATIGKVKNVSESLAENIANVTKLSDNSADGARQITTSIEQLAKAAIILDENVQNINTKMSDIGDCVNDISGNVEHLYSSSETMLQTNNEAKTSMEQVMGTSRESVQAVAEIAEQIGQTNESITEIDKAVELILAISEQTNLLSLNATIEAARAGVQGRGFAVVAEEIRGLANQTAQGAEMIKNLAQNITDKSEKSVALADSLRTLITMEQESVKKTQTKFETHSQDINKSVDEIRAIAQKTDYLIRHKETVIESVEELSVVSAENAASNEEVSANIGRIIDEVQSVNEHCTTMNVMAKELEASVSYFKEEI